MNPEPKELRSLMDREKPVLAVDFTTTRRDAEKWYALGLQKHQAFERGMKQARRDVVDAAFAFLRCRAAFDYGEWGEFLMLHTDISPRTVRDYIELARHAQDWALRSTSPMPKTIEAVNAIARDLILYSPKPLIELCRDLKFMRPFGEYDRVKYHQAKEDGSQLSFDFSRLAADVDVLTHLGEKNFELKFADGVDQVGALKELKAKLKLIDGKIDAEIAGWKAVLI